MTRPVGTPNHDVMEVYQFIRTFILSNHYSPSMREIVDGTSLSSTSAVAVYIDKLVEAGYLTKIDGIARGILLTDKE